MHFVDHLFVFLVFIVYPVYGFFDARRYLERVKSGEPENRPRIYVETSIIQWAFLAVFGATWLIFGRPWSDLGFVPAAGLPFWIGTVVLVAFIALLVFSWQTAKRESAEKRAKQLEGLGEMLPFVPQTRRELSYFFLVSLTAGIVEEVVYRGFTFWYLGSFLPLWVVVLLSSVGFGAIHFYMGVNGAVRAGLVGLGFALFYVLTGSIWLPIVAHIALDMLQGLLFAELSRKDEEPVPSALSDI
jgi:membrane protease YdiL (CAAX protease family)